LALVDLERKAVERLARQLIPHLVASDIVTAEVKDLDNVEQWRPLENSPTAWKSSARP
jgi:hypothetical protein